MDAIVVDGLEKTYGKDVRALAGMTFSVPEGQVFGLLGPNGAGKSTTVRILVTLSTADGGTASVAGHDVRREAVAVRRAIGYVPQASGVDREGTGLENLVLQGRLQGMSGAELERRARELLELFSLGREGRCARPHLLGRTEAASRRGDGARAPAARPLPRRAHDGARPRGTRRDVGGARPARDRASS